jgi:hypothetical protein
MHPNGIRGFVSTIACLFEPLAKPPLFQMAILVLQYVLSTSNVTPTNICCSWHLDQWGRHV